jgi:hypothetical protein
LQSDWNFQAGRLTGDGLIEIIETELPITISSIEAVLSAPSRMSGTITPAIARLKQGGRAVFEPHNTVLVAEADNQVRGLGIYQPTSSFDDGTWNISTLGLTSYASGTPYVGEENLVAYDPLDIFRLMWSHMQSRPMGNLGITIDSLTSPVRVGTAATSEDTFESGPRKLNPWDTPDLGREIDNYAQSTPFDWLETYQWNGDYPQCHIKLGYPTIGGRYPKLRLVLGENMVTAPQVQQNGYVNEVHVLGAGEGRAKVRGYSGISDGRIRRAIVIEDPNITTVADANRRASDELAASRGEYYIDSVTVRDHPNAPLSELELGREVPVYAEGDQVDYDGWGRVVAKNETPGDDGLAVLTLVRSNIA